MTTPKWSSFPRKWMFDRLSRFPAGAQAGAHMAALRVYLALALRADFNDRTASVSLTELQTLTGLSRPMVTKGIAKAASTELVAVDNSGYRHSYRLLGQEDDTAFAKIPKSRLRQQLPKLPTRGFHALDALKVYLALVLVRPRDSFTLPISVRLLAARSGVQPRRVRAAIDVLINHRLVRLVEVDGESGAHGHHAYRLLGFDVSDAADEVSETTHVANRGSRLAEPGYVDMS